MIFLVSLDVTIGVDALFEVFALLLIRGLLLFWFSVLVDEKSLLFIVSPKSTQSSSRPMLLIL